MAKSNDGKVTVEDLVLQTSVAFGQGAVGRTLTHKASRLLRSYFVPRFEHHLGHYQKHRLGILAYARGLGWYAATLASGRGQSMIDGPDVRKAIDEFPCPFAEGRGPIV